MPTLKELIAGDDLVVAPVALNPIMARLAEQTGFKAVYLSGGSLGCCADERDVRSRHSLVRYSMSACISRSDAVSAIVRMMKPPP